MSATLQDLAAQSAAAARIDWATGRLIGFSVPAAGGDVFDVVELSLDNRVVATALANRSVFDLARDLTGLPLPSREACAFELRIPQGSLLPSQLVQGEVVLAIRTREGKAVFEQKLDGPHELLQLADAAPVDLLYEVSFRGVRDGVLQGLVRDRLGAVRRPALQWRLNDGPAAPLVLLDSSADGRVHLFQLPLPAAQLTAGQNLLHVTGREGQPLASYPIRLGTEEEAATTQRVAALEAQVNFLKHLLLSQPSEALPARLELLKSEIIGICSEMLAMQRTNFERETQAAVAMALADRDRASEPALPGSTARR